VQTAMSDGHARDDLRCVALMTFILISGAFDLPETITAGPKMAFGFLHLLLSFLSGISHIQMACFLEV